MSERALLVTHSALLILSHLASVELVYYSLSYFLSHSDVALKWEGFVRAAVWVTGSAVSILGKFGVLHSHLKFQFWKCASYFRFKRRELADQLEERCNKLAQLWPRHLAEYILISRFSVVFIHTTLSLAAVCTEGIFLSATHVIRRTNAVKKSCRIILTGSLNQKISCRGIRY